MPEIRSIEIPVAEVAALLHVQPQTVQRRLRAGELDRATTVDGRTMVRLVPGEDWLRVEDASALLRVSPATIRSNVSRGRLSGQRGRNERWRVLLRSVLEDPRCDPAAVEVFGGEPAPVPSEFETNSRRPHSLHRQLNVRLTEEEAELLERCRERHGTIRQAVVRGLEASDREEPTDGEHAELVAERDLYQEQTERLRSAHRGLATRVHDELYCQECDQWVPEAEWDEKETAGGHVEVFHKKHGHRSGTRFRSTTGLARRTRITRETPAD
jgi:hypothetical protein